MRDATASALRAPGVATDPGPIVIRVPPAYGVNTSQRPWPNSSGGSPRPGISAHPSTVTGAPSAGSRVT